MRNKRFSTCLVVLFLFMFGGVFVSDAAENPAVQRKTSMPEQGRNINRAPSSFDTMISESKRLAGERQQVVARKHARQYDRKKTATDNKHTVQLTSALEGGSSWLTRSSLVPVTIREHQKSPFSGMSFPGKSLPEREFAQDFTIVSASPADQSLDVETETTISVTFSDSLDKYAVLDIMIFPSIRSDGNFLLSEDGKTISTTVTLDTNTTYQLYVMTAANTDGDNIQPQHVSTFSTGSAMPTGEIYGNVTFPNDPETYVSFVAAYLASSMKDDDPTYRVAQVTTGSGAYRIENLPAGEYLLLAIQDINGDLQLDGEDALSVYDMNSDGEPDEITLGEGESAGNYDFQVDLFAVSSTYPVDYEVSVPTNTTLSLTFNMAVDYEEDFEVLLSPEPLEFGKESVSADGKTLSVPVTLAENTVYQFIVGEARTLMEPSQELSEPYFAIFTTGDAFPNASVSGTVTFDNFTPLIALAFLVPTNGNDEVLNVAEINLENGTYKIENIQPGSYYAAYFAAGADDIEIDEMYEDSLTIAENDSLTDIDITMSPGPMYSLYGLISGEGSIPRVYISAYNSDNDSEFQGQTNLLGYYHMMLPEGVYYFYFYPQDGSGLLGKDTSGVNITGDKELNISLQTGNFIYGVVSDTSGAPLEDVDIGVAYSSTGEEIAWDRTDEDGEFRIGLQPGTYNVYFYQPQQSAYLSTYFENIDITSDYELNVELEEGFYLDGNVMNEDSEFLESVEIYIFDSGTNEHITSSRTNEQGYYGLGLTAGTYDVTYEPRWEYGTEYLRHEERDVTISADTTIHVTLQHGTIISGLVTGPDDNPVDDVQVEVTDTMSTWITNDWTDENGEFELVVAAGIYHLSFSPPEYLDLLSQQVEYLSVPPDTFLNIKLQEPEKRTLSGVVTDSFQVAFDSVEVRIYNTQTYRWIQDEIMTNENGAFQVDLTDGDYYIIFRPAPKWEQQGTPPQVADPSIISVASDTLVSFVLQTGSLLYGYVTSDSGNAVAGASLFFSDDMYNLSVTDAGTGTDGYYDVYLVPDYYMLQISPPPFSGLFSVRTGLDYTGEETPDFILSTIPAHDTGEVVLSVAAGRYGVSYEDGGQGFQYPAGQDYNHLFRSYLLIAGDEYHISRDMDFQPLGDPPYTITTPGAVSQQDVYTMFDDRYSLNPLNVTVTQYTYAFSEAPDNDYVIVRLILSNKDDYSKDIAVGMYCDWDVGINTGQNSGGFDTDYHLGYIYDVSGDDSVYVGTSLITPHDATSFRVYDVGTAGNLDNNDQYASLTNGIQNTHAGPGDLRYYISYGSLALPPQESGEAEVWFAFVAGDNLADLQANAGAAQSKFTSIIIGIDQSETPAVPTVYSLSQNYPNPFNPDTRISYELPEKSHVQLTVFNMLGQKVKTLVAADKAAGFYSVEWDGTDTHGFRLPTGVYVYRMEAGEFRQCRKLVLLR